MKYIRGVILLIILVLLIFGGLGYMGQALYVVGLITPVLFTAIHLISGNKLKLPPYVQVFAAFLLFTFLHIVLFTRDNQQSINYFLLFLSGGAFWIYAYNKADLLYNKLDKIIIVLGTLIGFLFIFNNVFGDPQSDNVNSLFQASTPSLNHNHIGALWAIVLGTIVYKVMIDKKYLYLLLVPVGIYFLLYSQSRSAYIALVAGALYLLNSTGVLKRNKMLAGVILSVPILLFFVTSIYKTTVFSRPYYIQAVLGLISKPTGVGLGNFIEVFSYTSGVPILTSYVSTLAHNIILEILVGIGILGFSFVLWLALVIYDAFYRKEAENLVFHTIFLIITVNFMFDFTYFIPTMLWLWFMSLGLAQASIETNETTKKISA